jgi:hypothetical protein
VVLLAVGFLARTTAMRVDPRVRNSNACDLFATLKIKGVLDSVERSVPAPQTEIVMHRRAGWQVLQDRPPLTSGAQNIPQPVDDFTDVHMALVATAFRRRNDRREKPERRIGQIARVTQPAAVMPREIFVRPRLPTESGRLA